VHGARQVVCCELLPFEDVEWHDFGGGKARFQVVLVVNGMVSPRSRGAMAPGAIASVPPSSQLLDVEPPPWL